MKCKIILVLTLLMLHLGLIGQIRTKTTDFKNWSKWIPIIDNNQNKIQVSINFEPLTTGQQVNNKIWFNYKLLNKYNEPISGRLQYTYISTDGTERKMNCVLNCLEPDEEYFNFFYSQMNVAKVLDFGFIEFTPCSSKSKLVAYTAKDSVIFSIYKAIKNEEVQKQNLLASSNENERKNILIDNSDGTVLYRGVNESNIKTLLSKVKGWRTNSGLQIQDGIPPQVIYNNDCQRDVYVNSAVLYSWAAESYYRIKEAEKAKVAASKVGELLQFAEQLCSNGGISFQSGACKTEAIFPCGTTNNLNISGNNSYNSVQQQPIKSEIQNGKSSNSNTNPADFSKEKELFSGLLPVISAFGTNSYETQATSLVDFADKLATYTDNDSMSSVFLKVMTKLAALNVKMQANEMTNNYNPSSIINSKGSSTSTSMGVPLINSTDFSQMNSFQQKQFVEDLVTPLVSALLERTENEEGRTAKEQKAYDDEEEAFKIKNKEYREKYGFSIRQFFSAIVEFDNKLLDNIIESGFPLDATLYNHERYHDIHHNFSDYRPIILAAKYGNDYAIKKLIQRGIDINKYSGYSLDNPLFVACYFERYNTVKLLLEKGAIVEDKYAKGGDNSTKWRLKTLKSLRYYEILSLLERYSSKQ